MRFDSDVAIVGGCGHVGLPLGLAFAERGLKVVLYDINAASVEEVNAARMPFDEARAPEVLAHVVGANLLTATTDPSSVATAAHIVVVVGTPVDEHLNPDPSVVTQAVKELAPHFRAGQLLVLRSTVYPGTTRVVEDAVEDLGCKVGVAFCPERIAEGRAMTELFELPQIVAARDELVFEKAEKLFGTLTSQTVRLSPEEAELAKLFTNTWRYIKFATANQLFMMANDFGLDYERIRSALAFDYPRARDLPRAGFAAGPCLLKDTMQLAAFNNNNFFLGHAAMMINEGLPLYVVSKLQESYPVSDLRFGILGMAFKEESDDVRSSLSFKLRRILKFKAKSVACHDPYVKDQSHLRPLDEVLATSDVLIIAAPHGIYRDLEVSVPLIDIWGVNSNGIAP